MQKKTTCILRLSDGRELEYVEYGDPNGQPVFYFHGFMGSCYQGLLADEFAKIKHLRVISPNRPGIGRSTPATFSAMTEYADDIRQLADHLQIDTFAILGASAGSCFALACAYVMPIPSVLLELPVPLHR